MVPRRNQGMHEGTCFQGRTQAVRLEDVVVKHEIFQFFCSIAMRTL
jgi:hypothetical protein